MLHYQDMHNAVLLPHSCASLHWIFLKRLPLAVCVHGPAPAPKAPSVNPGFTEVSGTAEQGWEFTPLPSGFTGSSSCIPKLFFSCTSGTQSRALDYCNTEQLTHSWLLPACEHQHRVLHLLRSFLSDIHTGKHISLYIFKFQAIQYPLSIFTWCKHISLFLSTQKQKPIQSLFFFLLSGQIQQWTEYKILPDVQ